MLSIDLFSPAVRDEPIHPVMGLTHRISPPSFGTSIPGGFSSCDFSLACSSSEAFDWYANKNGYHVLIHEGGHCVWEGRIDNVAMGAEGVSIRCVGYWVALTDRTLYQFWSTDKIEDWREGSLEWIYSTVGLPVPAFSNQKFEIETGAGLYVAPQHDATYINDDSAVIVYALPIPPETSSVEDFWQQPNVIQSIVLDVRECISAANFDISYSIWATSDHELAEWTPVVEYSTVVGTGLSFVLPSTTRAVMLRVGTDTASVNPFTGETGDARCMITRIFLKSTHEIVTPSEIMKQSIAGYEPDPIGEGILVGSPTIGTVLANSVLTFSFACEAGPHRLLVLRIAIRSESGAALGVSTVTFGGVTVTKQRHDTATAGCRTEIWTLANPTAHTADIVITLTGSEDSIVAEAILLKNVSLVFFTAGYNNSGDDTPSANALAGNTDLVLDVLSAYDSPTVSLALPGSGQSQDSNTTDGANLRMATSHKLGVDADDFGVVNMSWELSEIPIVTMTLITVTYFSPALEDEIATFYPQCDQLRTSTRFIQNSVVPELPHVIHEGVTLQDIAVQLGVIADQSALRSWFPAVWDNRYFHFGPRIVDQVKWRLSKRDLADGGLQLERGLEGYYSHVQSFYENDRGSKISSSIKSDPRYRDSVPIQRRSTIDMGPVPLLETSRDAFYEDSRIMHPVAQIIVSGNVWDSRGSRTPLWHVRAGDVIQIDDLLPGRLIKGDDALDPLRTFYIKETMYDSGTNTLSITPAWLSSRLETLLANVEAF